MTRPPHDDYVRNVEHFGVQLVLTPDEAQFVRAWSASGAPSSLPATASVRRGSSVTAMLVFQGCTPDVSGKCDVVANFSLLAPDGTLIPGGTGLLWSDEPMPGRLHLGNASMGVSFDVNDPVGQYKVIATVKDKVSGKKLSLGSALKVLE
ncbi:hypothetical protein [Aromatoleum diolicum]|uniref:Uncharacterized protein n=1 Tax=Aromatoleum diolicum TaxID=75796 RepID=A0ABX1Q7X2_9RHOO|nr:hypothetical protein [Aromatoleum diolicum]NMG73516.1 hypothetical protein [Aromatoleum diolicum]